VAFDYIGRGCTMLKDSLRCVGYSFVNKISKAANVTDLSNLAKNFFDKNRVLVHAMILMKLLDDDKTTYSTYTYVGFANDDFVGVVECRSKSINDIDLACKATKSNMVVIIRSEGILKDKKRHYFEYEGSIGNEIYVSPDDYI
jgi:hypothetical protein